MQEHPTDEQLLDLLAGAGDARAREHFAVCPACCHAHESLRRVLGHYHEEARAAAERPESFWQRQRAAIAARRTDQSAPRRLAWAAAVAMVLLAAVLLTERTPPAAPAAETDPDHTLLVDVERSVRRELPRALEPAALLAQEVGRNAETRSNP